MTKRKSEIIFKRNPKGESYLVVSISLYESDIEKIEIAQKELNVSRSEAIRMLIRNSKIIKKENKYVK